MGVKMVEGKFEEWYPSYMPILAHFTHLSGGTISVWSDKENEWKPWSKLTASNMMRSMWPNGKQR